MITTDHAKLLSCRIEELGSLTASLDSEGCAYHARLIADGLPGPTYEQYIAELFKVAMPLSGETPCSADLYCSKTRLLYPTVRSDSDLLSRLAILSLRLIQFQIEKRLQSDKE